LAFPNEVFFGSLFWLGVLVGVLAVFFGVVTVLAFVTGSIPLKEVSKHRAVYTLIRVGLFAYFPFVVWTTYTFTLGSDATAGIIISIIFLVVVVLGLPAWIFYILPRDKAKGANLFLPSFLKKFGPLYNSYFFKRSWFMEVHLGKKILLGAVIGLLNSYEVAQLVLVLLIHLAYGIAIFVLKPYLDHVHTFLEIAVAIGNVIVTGCMFVFIQSAADDQIRLVFAGITAGFLLLCQVMCIGAFINSWFRLRNIITWADFLGCLKGKNSVRKSEGDEIEMPTTKVE